MLRPGPFPCNAALDGERLRFFMAATAPTQSWVAASITSHGIASFSYAATLTPNRRPRLLAPTRHRMPPGQPPNLWMAGVFSNLSRPGARGARIRAGDPTHALDPRPTLTPASSTSRPHPHQHTPQGNHHVHRAHPRQETEPQKTALRDRRRNGRPAVGHGRRRLARRRSGGDGIAPRTMEVDIAEDGTRFVIDEAPVFDDGFPAYGNPFLTPGYIYPAGTLTDSNGVNPDGSPEFPEKVIGEWTCPATSSRTGPTPPKAPWVFTTELFAFGDDPDTGPDTSSSPDTRAPRSKGSSPARSLAVPAGTPPLGVRQNRSCSGLNDADLVHVGINKTVELKLEGEGPSVYEPGQPVLTDHRAESFTS